MQSGSGLHVARHTHPTNPFRPGGSYDLQDSHVLPAQAPLINIAAGEDQSIADLAPLIAGVFEYSGEFVYDASKPDGTPRKLLDALRLAALGWRPKANLRQGIALANEDFLRRGDAPRATAARPAAR